MKIPEGSFWLQGPHPPLFFQSQLPPTHPNPVLGGEKIEDGKGGEGRINENVCVVGVQGVGMLRRASKASLSSRTFCNGRNALCLHFPIGKLLATCSYSALEMCDGGNTF